MKNIILSLVTFLIINFSSLSYNNVDGNSVSMSSYAGKKIMLVNIATNSDKVGQLAQLKQLQQQFADSLVIVLFPSNNFGHENRTNAQIKTFCQTHYNFTFNIAATSNVTGSTANAIYNWLSQSSQNGDMNAVIGGDYQKFVISKTGEIIGSYSPKISPMDAEIINVINTPYQ